MGQKSIFKRPIDIYLYDADHKEIDQRMAFTYYDDVFAEVFIAIVDDWNWSCVRKGTFDAFDQLHYEVLYEKEILPGIDVGNGQYIAVIRKKQK